MAAMTRIRIVLALSALGLVAPLAVADDAGSRPVGRLDAESWASPRSGERIVAMPVVAEAVRRWSRNTGGRLLVKHRGGEDGSLWAAELADWLVALGVPSSAIERRPAEVPSGQLILGLTAGSSER